MRAIGTCAFRDPWSTSMRPLSQVPTCLYGHGKPFVILASKDERKRCAHGMPAHVAALMQMGTDGRRVHKLLTHDTKLQSLLAANRQHNTHRREGPRLAPDVHSMYDSAHPSEVQRRLIEHALPPGAFLIYVSLFCGLGGDALGALRADVRVLDMLGVDHDAAACRAFDLATGFDALHKDVFYLDVAAEIRKLCSRHAWRAGVHVWVHAGSSCKLVSPANPTLTEEERAAGCAEVVAVMELLQRLVTRGVATHISFENSDRACIDTGIVRMTG